MVPQAAAARVFGRRIGRALVKGDGAEPAHSENAGPDQSPWARIWCVLMSLSPPCEEQTDQPSNREIAVIVALLVLLVWGFWSFLAVGFAGCGGICPVRLP